MESHDPDPDPPCRVDVNSQGTVFYNRIQHDIPDEITHELLDIGAVGQVDFDIGPTLDRDAISDHNDVREGTLVLVEQFSRTGGYVLVHLHEGTRVVVGRARPGCLRFERIQLPDGSERVLKCVQLDAFADIDPAVFDGIVGADAIGKPQHVFVDLNEEAYPQLIDGIVSALETLEDTGRLNYQ